MKIKSYLLHRFSRFFLNSARLNRQELIGGFSNWGLEPPPTQHLRGPPLILTYNNVNSKHSSALRFVRTKLMKSLRVRFTFWPNSDFLSFPCYFYVICPLPFPPSHDNFKGTLSDRFEWRVSESIE
jgi:hypothetical protein